VFGLKQATGGKGSCF